MYVKTTVYLPSYLRLGWLFDLLVFSFQNGDNAYLDHKAVLRLNNICKVLRILLAHKRLK